MHVDVHDFEVKQSEAMPTALILCDIVSLIKYGFDVMNIFK